MKKLAAILICLAAAGCESAPQDGVINATQFSPETSWLEPVVSGRDVKWVRRVQPAKYALQVTKVRSDGSMTFGLVEVSANDFAAAKIGGYWLKGRYFPKPPEPIRQVDYNPE